MGSHRIPEKEQDKVQSVHLISRTVASQETLKLF